VSDESECKHGFDPSWCADCKDPVHAKPRSLKRIDDREDWEKPAWTNKTTHPGRSFEARFSSQCLGCGKVIRPGQSATWMSDGSVRHNLPGCILATPGQATYSDRKDARE